MADFDESTRRIKQEMELKTHLKSLYSPLPACKTSGRKGQSKGVVFGLSPSEFAKQSDQCVMCARELTRRNSLAKKQLSE